MRLLNGGLERDARYLFLQAGLMLAPVGHCPIETQG